MKKLCLMFVGLLLVGCVNATTVGNKGVDSVLKTDILKKVEVNPNEDELEVLLVLKENDQGSFDYTDKEQCFHSKGIWQSDHYWIEVFSDPHDYHITWVIVGEKQYDGNVDYVATYSIQDFDYRLCFDESGFEWEEMTMKNQKFGYDDILHG